MVGEEVEKVRGGLKVTYPIENGRVSNWDDMEHLWNYIFHDKLGVDTKEHNIMLTEAPLNPMENRAQMLEHIFEKFGFNAVHIDIQALLVLYAQGKQQLGKERSSDRYPSELHQPLILGWFVNCCGLALAGLWDGVVVDSGDGVTHIVAVIDGMVPKELITRLNIAGRHVTDELLTLLQNRGYVWVWIAALLFCVLVLVEAGDSLTPVAAAGRYALNKTADFHAIQQIKEKFCYIP